jgi:multidrug efflux pump subunit AcrA (membrane-fusion protein)
LRLSLLDSLALVGSAVEVALPERVPVNAMAVPRDALVVRADGSYVMRIGDGGTSEKVAVQSGASDGELTEVEGPLKPGDLVVVRGAERLGEGQKVQIASRGEVVAGVASTAAKPPG